ncbi:MAG: hypothetical protein OHK0019_00890 [Saprospiraceae bacterium]
MTAKELAQQLNGCEYLQETTAHTKGMAKQNGLVIVFAYSDDNCEFQGAIEEEIPCWNGQKIHFNKDGSNFTNESGESFLTYHKDKDEPETNMIEAVWCEKEKVFHENGDYYSWTYKTELPHETFDVFEDGKPFCRGIIFSVFDCK